VATGGGLCVAIPALVAHRILRERADNLILMMEEKTAKFLEMMPDYAKRVEPQRVLFHGVKDAVSKK
jgi:biopolymer transport protein ExbB/TolQ